MPQAAPQQSLDQREWLSLEDAAALMECSERHVRRRAQEDWSGVGLARIVKAAGPGRSSWMIHRRADARLASSVDRPTRDARARESLMARFPADYVERAFVRAHWMNEWRKRLGELRVAGETDADLASAVVQEAKETEGAQFKISVRSLQIWWRGYNEPGASGHIRGAEALVDKYGASPVLKHADGDDPPTSYEPQAQARGSSAVDFFYSLYRTENKLSLRLCHEMTLIESGKRGWSWPASASATRSWLAKFDDLSKTFLMRFGQSAWAHRFMPYLQMDWRSQDPGEFFVTDHKQCDFWVRRQMRGVWENFRPWLTAVQDCRTRAIVGWKLAVSPNQDTIIAALRMAFRQWAIPKVMRIDNGKDFTAQAITGLTKKQRREMRKEHGPGWKDVVRKERLRLDCDKAKWTGIAEELGINIIYALPYSPWSKGTLERWFRTFGERCAKLFVTWCGDKPQTRPETLKDILAGRGRQAPPLTKGGTGGSSSVYEPQAPARGSSPCATAVSAVSSCSIPSAQGGTEGGSSPKLSLIDSSDIPTLEEARTAVGEYLVRYHNTAHTGDGMDGETPIAVWNTATSLRRADADALAFLMSIRGQIKVTGNGVRVTMDGRSVSYGGSNPVIRPYVGRDVLVAVDEDDPTECFAFDPGSRRLIGRLTPNERLNPGVTHDDVREGAQEAIKDRCRGQNRVRGVQRASAYRTRRATQIANELARDRTVELQATGTDNVSANIVPVPTGFEGTSTPVRTAREIVPLPRPPTATLEDFLAGPDDVETAPRALGLDFFLNEDRDPKEDDEAEFDIGGEGRDARNLHEGISLADFV